MNKALQGVRASNVLLAVCHLELVDFLLININALGERVGIVIESFSAVPFVGRHSRGCNHRPPFCARIEVPALCYPEMRFRRAKVC